MAKKTKKPVKATKKPVRREYTKADVKELRADSKAKTPVDKIAKLSSDGLARCVRRHSSSVSDPVM